MAEVTTVPPMSILTCAVVAPLVTSTILPFNTLRALILMSSLPLRVCCRREQSVQLPLAEIDLIEPLVEIAGDAAQILWKLLGIEDRRQPTYADQPVDPGRRV